MSTNFDSSSEFTRLYLQAREKENRLYSDEQLARLPQIGVGHPHFEEWEIRKKSASLLLHHLGGMGRPADILEVGCGNGWLASEMANLNGATVTGVDLNAIELEQAKQVFGHKKNLHFIESDFLKVSFEHQQFDVVVFAASIQYFAKLVDVLGQALSLLKVGGEVHILDSIFYSKASADKARARTERYYHELGVREMRHYYFHHSMEDLKGYRYRVLSRPLPFSVPGRRNNPFYWVMIKK